MRALLFASFLRASVAVLVANGSPCQSDCGNINSATPVNQIVCQDEDYISPEGKVFQSCVSCESISSYSTTGQNETTSDLQALLYNARFTTAQCLFHIHQGPCSTSQACAHIQTALEYGNFSTTVNPYGYCNQWSDYDLQKCTECLVVAGQTYIRNFVSLLSGACQLRLQPPETIPLTGNLFSESLVNVTTPNPSEGKVPRNSVGPLSYGALAGIVIGGVVVLLIVAGCGVIINGKRRRKEYLRRREKQMSHWPSPQVMGGEMYETPTSQVPLRGNGWSDSPNSATTDGAYPPYPRYHSPYTSQYSSPVTGVEAPSQMAWPTEKTGSIGVALSPNHDESDKQSSDRKGKERADVPTDTYELQEGVHSAGGHGNPGPQPSVLAQAPVPDHPGHVMNGHTHHP